MLGTHLIPSFITEDYWKVGWLSFLGAGILFLCYRAFFHPLAKFPGPPLARITGLWRLYHYIIGDWHEIILPLHQKYGRVVRLAPNELSVVDEAATKFLYGHGTKAIKGDWYRGWQPPGAAPNIFAMQDEVEHVDIRRRWAPAFKTTALLRLEGSMQSCLDNIWSQLEKNARDGQVVDMCHWTNALAWDIIGELCYGEPLGVLEDTDTMDVRKLMFGNFVTSAILGHVWGQLAWVDNPITRLIGVKNPVVKFFEWSSAKVSEHEKFKDTGRQQDLADLFLAYVDAEGKPASHLQVVDAVTATIGAGADTVSVAMRSVLYYLGVHPDMLRKVQAEVDSLDTTGPITYKQTQQLPYLKAVVRESLRMYPSIPAQLYRFVPEQGMAVDDQYIPAGTVVGMSGLAQNRDELVFGSDVNVFKPERWLGGAEEQRRLEASLFNFGGNGPRSCPGRDLAMIELYKFIAQMVQKFEFRFLDEKHPFKVRTYFFTFQSDMRMIVTPRQKETSHAI